MQEGFAIIRALELRFGKIRDYKLLHVSGSGSICIGFSHHASQDLEVHEMYAPMIWACFEDDSNFDALPRHDDTDIKLVVPAFESAVAGDTSLSDLDGLLRPLDKPAPGTREESWIGSSGNLRGDDKKLLTKEVEVSLKVNDGRASRLLSVCSG